MASKQFILAIASERGAHNLLDMLIFRAHNHADLRPRIFAFELAVQSAVQVSEFDSDRQRPSKPLAESGGAFVIFVECIKRLFSALPANSTRYELLNT